MNWLLVLRRFNFCTSIGFCWPHASLNFISSRVSTVAYGWSQKCCWNRGRLSRCRCRCWCRWLQLEPRAPHMMRAPGLYLRLACFGDIDKLLMLLIGSDARDKCTAIGVSGLGFLRTQTFWCASCAHVLLQREGVAGWVRGWVPCWRCRGLWRTRTLPPGARFGGSAEDAASPLTVRLFHNPLISLHLPGTRNGPVAVRSGASCDQW